MNTHYYGIAPVRTLYEGFEFRSQLEAKWAIFFDLCKLEWQYEPHEPFRWEEIRTTPYGKKVVRDILYKPDFLVKLELSDWIQELPDYFQEAWVEIKFEDTNKTDELQISLLSRDTNKPVIFLIGDPSKCTMKICSPPDEMAKLREIDCFNLKGLFGQNISSSDFYIAKMKASTAFFDDIHAGAMGSRVQEFSGFSKFLFG